MTAEFDQSLELLSRGLDQAGDAIAEVAPDQLSMPTPCPDWDVARLITHLIQDAERFALAVNGGEPDWSILPEPVTGDGAAAFRTAANQLVAAWEHDGGQAQPGPAWQAAEIAIHTWDLVRATGQDRPLDPAVADLGLAFMSAALSPDMRGDAFAPEVPAPIDAPAYDRLAAFAGRDVD